MPSLAGLRPLKVGVVALLGWMTHGCDRSTPPPTAPARVPERPGRAAVDLHAPFDALLRTYVKDGVVSYATLKKEEGRLDGYLATLDATDPEALDRGDRLAFWINAYNAFTLKLILRHYPGVKSIKDIPARWTTAEWSVHGKKYSLDDIEHRILRPAGEPRIHFAIVCASKSCPDLASEAYAGSRLDDQLSAAARRFFADPRKGFRTSVEKGWLGGESPTVHLSSILKWFGDDFVKAKGSALAFAEPYLPEEGRTFLKAHPDPAIRYLDYDWSLNGE